MFVRAASATLWGIDAHPVSVEAFLAHGLPSLTLVGLARGAVKESVVRVRSALQSVGAELTTKKLVVNMLPAELPKEASALDLPLAAALLAIAQVIPAQALVGRRFFGELSLDGAVQPVRGAVLLADLARRMGDAELFVPMAQAAEGAIIPGIRVIGVPNLAALVAHLTKKTLLPVAVAPPASPAHNPKRVCLSDVRGQKRAKFALEVAAAGNHNLLLVGPPGSGKSMLAERLHQLLPDLDAEERIEVTRIQAAAEKSSGGPTGLITQRPYRAPHHTVSDVALVGGGAMPGPGEVTLAHRGVLFLDELPEFSRRALEALREPLEQGSICISRAAYRLTMPSSVLLIAAMNPCPCGQLRSPRRRHAPGRPCLCGIAQIEKYRARLSGPLLDRIDLHVEVAPVPFSALYAGTDAEPSGDTSLVVRARVAQARMRQTARLGAGRTNASLTAAELHTLVPMQGAIAQTIKRAMHVHGLSARAVARVLQVARTVADLRGQDTVERADVARALDLRLWERNKETRKAQKKTAPYSDAAHGIACVAEN